MVNYLEILSQWMSQPHYLLLILILTYFIAGTLDFLIGTFNAAYTEGVEFSSRTAQLGIVRKLATFALMILVVPLALMLPLDVGIYSLTILYVGIVGSEVYSIMENVGIVNEGQKYKNLNGSLFTQLLGDVYRAKGVEKGTDKDE